MLEAEVKNKIMNEVDRQFDDQTKVLADLVKIPSTRLRQGDVSGTSGLIRVKSIATNTTPNSWKANRAKFARARRSHGSIAWNRMSSSITHVEDYRRQTILPTVDVGIGPDAIVSPPSRV